jgi:LPXTG-site transpeptidase (sortase) family protein
MLTRVYDRTRSAGPTWTLGRCRRLTTPVTVERMRGRSAVRAAIRAFGFGCLMVAAGLAGHVTWILWGTGLETARAQDELRTELVPSFDDPTPPGGKERYLPGEAYAAIVIPSIDLDFVVVEGPEGVSYLSSAWTEALKKGPTHYADSADPWDDGGRVGIAGHRTTYLHPFLELDRVRPDDRIELITKHGSYVYEVDRSFVLPEAGSGVVLEQTKRPTLVLTTCHPRYSSRERLIVTAALVEAPAAA